MTLERGVRLGAYEILSPLGAGGMGEVYRARDPRLGRDVALKVLPAEFARDADRLARFEREARAVAALNHPNIITLHSIEEDSGVRFLTMELVEGESLDRVVSSGGLPPMRVLDLAVPLADALVAAHEKGVVHRDLKPANVMVTREGRVKVLDFGLAKLAPSESSADATQAPTLVAPLSGTGVMMGTAPYMAPEQVRGETVDARTDVFALGIVIYELASGRRPFAGASSADLSSAILRDSPEPLASAAPGVLGDLDRIIRRCLEKSPRDRYQGARDVYDELRLLKRSLEHSATAPVPKAATERSIAVLPFSNMSADPENEFFSDGLTEELLNVLAKVPELKVAGRTSSFAFKGKHEDMREIGHKLGVETLLEGSVRRAGNRVRITAQLIKVADGFHLWSDTYDRVVDDIFAVQDDIARSVSAALHVTLLGKPSTAPKGNAESYELLLRANHLARHATESTITRAVPLFREAIAKAPDDARPWAGLAKAYAFQAFYGYGAVAECHAKAREAAERAIALAPGLSAGHEIMAGILASLEFRLEEARAEARKALELAPGTSGPMMTVAVYDAAMGYNEKSQELARRAIELDPLDAHAHINRARIESWAGNLEGACAALLRALELSPEIAPARTVLGLLYLRLGRHDEALAEIAKEAQAGYREHAFAIAYHLLGDRERSDASLARLEAQGEQWGYQIAMAHAVRGETDEAFRWLERAYELHDSGVALSKVTYWLQGLHSDPRWPPFLRKVGMEP